jgi:uncharacterized protein with von Willebrand factor type A (vWA) domain
MFIDFFYLLRAYGLNISLKEWLTLTEALDQGLCHASLLNFYYLCRTVLIKSEKDFDKFDGAFLEYFKNIQQFDKLPKELQEWLEKPVEVSKEVEAIKRLLGLQNSNLTLEEIMRRFEERMKEQHERHDTGNYWIGTGGTSAMGHSGFSAKGIRVGGEGKNRSAVKLAGEHHYQDFREDKILSLRQFQMAFRKLRQFSSRLDGPKTELDLDGTIEETSNKAGMLQLQFQRPRQNTIKLLLLFDSGGSMYPYSSMCSALFQAASKSNHFKDLQVYYFHNCIYHKLYTTPHCVYNQWVDTEWILRRLNSDYRVIFIGDGCMSPTELYSPGGSYYYETYCPEPGLSWLQRLHHRFPHAVWLNPVPEKNWDYVYGSQTLRGIRQEFDMFELTLQGLEKALQTLLSAR